MRFTVSGLLRGITPRTLDDETRVGTIPWSIVQVTVP